MGNYEELKQAVAEVIKTNGNQEITGALLQNVLLSIISTVGKGATFAGVAGTNTNPGTPDANLFYITDKVGTFPYFGSLKTTIRGLYLFKSTGTAWESLLLINLSMFSLYPFSQDAVLVSEQNMQVKNAVKDIQILSNTAPNKKLQIGKYSRTGTSNVIQITGEQTGNVLFSFNVLPSATGIVILEASNANGKARIKLNLDYTPYGKDYISSNGGLGTMWLDVAAIWSKSNAGWLIPQDDVSATASDGKYVYSAGVNDKSNLATVMSAGGTGLIQNYGNLIFRAHWWNPKGTAGQFFSTVVPRATKDADGVMSSEVFARLGESGPIEISGRGANSLTLSYPNWADGGTRTLEIPVATTAHAGLMSVSDKAVIDRENRVVAFSGLDGMLAGKTIADLGEIIPLLGAWTLVLDITAPIRQVLGSVFLYTDNSYHQVTQEVHSNSYVQDDGTIDVDHNDNKTYIYRRAYGVHSPLIPDGQWSAWESLIPMLEPQEDVSSRPGDGKYVYSAGDIEKSNLTTVMSAAQTSLVQNYGNLIFRAHWWNPKGTAGQFFSTTVPRATTGADGVLSREVFARLGESAPIYISEQGANSMTLAYPNWAEGGTRTLEIPAATTAHAGLMSVSDKQSINDIKQLRIISAISGDGILDITEDSDSDYIKAIFANYKIEVLYQNIIKFRTLLFCSYRGNNKEEMNIPSFLGIQKISSTLYEMFMVIVTGELIPVSFLFTINNEVWSAQRAEGGGGSSSATTFDVISLADGDGIASIYAGMDSDYIKEIFGNIDASVYYNNLFNKNITPRFFYLEGSFKHCVVPQQFSMWKGSENDYHFEIYLGYGNEATFINVVEKDGVWTAK